MTPERPIRCRTQRDERRDILLDVVATVISEKGADAPSLVTFAKEAGVSMPVTYSQFQTREGLLVALYQRYDERFFVDLQPGLAGKPASRQMLADRVAEA